MPAFLDLIFDPLSQVPGGNQYSTLDRVLILSINSVFFILYSVLVVFVVFNLVKSLYKIYGADSAETHVEFRNGITNAVLAAVGLVVLSGALFIPKVIFNLIGVDYDLYDIIRN